MRSLLVVGMLVCATPAQGADVSLPVPSLLQRDSILRVRPVKLTGKQQRPLFSLRSQVDSGRQVVRLVDGDSDAGTAYVGMEYGSESDDDSEGESDVQPPLPPPPPSIESNVSKKDLKSEPVP